MIQAAPLGRFLVKSCTSMRYKSLPSSPHPMNELRKGEHMLSNVQTFTPPQTPSPIGPYNHVAKVGPFITIGGTAGIDPATGQLAGPDVSAQAKQILASFAVMLESVGSDLGQIVHINIFLKDMHDFDSLNRVYSEAMGDHRPARTVIGVHELPKPGALITMNLTAVTREQM